jgi:hypothetical protein
MEFFKTVIRGAALLIFAVSIAACGGVEDTLDDEPSTTEDALSLYCGGAGQTCCSGTCRSGLECNENNICRTPCGGVGERCCASSTCDSGNYCAGTSCQPIDGGGGVLDQPSGTCTACTTRSCGTDNSCGSPVYCGGCYGTNQYCSADGQCLTNGVTGGGDLNPCSLICPAGQSCRTYDLGQYCQ